MEILNQIETRVRRTMCDTFNVSTGITSHEGRISKKDFDILFLLAHSRKSPDMMKDILDFHRKFGIEYEGKPRMLDPELYSFRSRFMREEYREYILSTEGLINELSMVVRDPGMIVIHMEKALDALVDLVYVALGTAHLHGFDFNEAWRRVHAANMKKIRAPNAEASMAATGRGHAADVIKPPGWEPPSHKDLVEDNAHR